MLNRAQQLRASRRTTKPESVAAALKGWNTRDPFEAMDPLDAILLDNWFPNFAGLTIRNGSRSYATGLGTQPVKTLAWYNTAAINKFLAACGGAIYDISRSGVVGAPVKTGFSSDSWQTSLFNGKQFWVNGGDVAQVYDGSVMTVTGFSGANMGAMAGVGTFHNRVFFWTGVDPGFWYGGVASTTGTLTFFPLSMVSQSGNLLHVEVMSYDGGEGIAAYTCFFMTSGEVLIYAGTDPSNATTWQLAGRYTIPPPIAARAIARYGGDIYLTTSNDHQQLSKMFIALKLGEVAPPTKATGAVTIAHQIGANLPGWQALYYPSGTRMLYNIPNADGSFSQHIFNTSTQAWCRFRGWNAQHFAIFGDGLYFGTRNGAVLRADIDTTDAGTPIFAQSQQSWQLFETPLKKRVAAVRPVVQSNGLAHFNFGLGYDYKDSDISIPDATIVPDNSLVWGARNWGAPYVWGGSGRIDSRWNVAGGEGSAIGLSLTANTQIGATWIRTDFLLEPGSAL